jgi:type IV secretory pathway VirB10-like protein
MDDREILRQSAMGFQEQKKPVPPPPPALPEAIELPKEEAPPPPPPPAPPREPNPDIARHKANYLKALAASARVPAFSPKDQAQGVQVANTEHSGAMQQARSPYQLNAGSIIPATLMRPVSTDAPGQMVALVSLDVFDSRTGRFKLIPQGTKVVGRYDPEMGPQSRLEAVYRELQFPNGCIKPLEPTPILDAQGFAGVQDDVNHHFVQRYGAVVGLAAITAMVGLTGNSSNRDYRDYSPQREASQGAGRVFERAVDRDLSRAMEIPDTATIRGGYSFNLDVVKSISFTKPYDEKEMCQ